MTQQSKLSEALAATLLRFKEIDRDTIEALCKRAATLEHQVSQNSADIERETELRGLLQTAKANLSAIFGALGIDAESFSETAVRAIRQLKEDVNHLSESAYKWKTAECELSSAYLRLRDILGTSKIILNRPLAEQIWAATEAKASVLVKSHNQLQWALRELLAQTRDLHDAGPEGESYQSDTLENAIAVADALVGESVTEQYPIADEPLNRRIQELEVQLAAAEKAKGQVFISEAFISGAGMTVKDRTGSCRIRMGGLDVTESANIGVGSIAHIASEGRITETDQPLMWSENALRKLMKEVLADRETELATSFNETRESMDELMATTFKQAQENLANLPQGMDLKSVITVTGDDAIGALVKDIINTEMQPGGRIHKALISNSPMAQAATPVCPPGMGLACAGLNTLVHVSPTVKGDEAMARKVRDIIFEEMKHGGIIHSAFYRK